MMGNLSWSRFLRTKRRIVGPSLATAALLASSSGLSVGNTFAFSFTTTTTFFHQSALDRGVTQYLKPRRRRPSAARMVSLSDPKENFSTFESNRIGRNSDNKEEEEEWNDILPFTEGSHDSARIRVPSSAPEEPGELDPFDATTFRDSLAATVTVCRELSKSSVWVVVPMVRSSLIERGDMMELGFRYHHAVGDKAVLNVWLREDESKIPDFSTHNVGVGAVVINSRNEILCVRELRRNYMPWKTPTGLSELGEHIEEAAEREVFEETGIRATFNSVIGFRQTHGLAHGRSDLFFVCRLDPVEETDEDGDPIIPEPVAQESEIERAEWVPLDEYRDMVRGKDGEPGHPMMLHVLHALDAGRHIERKVVKSVVPGKAPNAIYYPVVKWDDDKN